MQSRFTHSFFEAITVLLLVGYLFRSLSLLIHLGDIFALIPSVIQLGVFVLLFLKNQHLPYWIKLWATYLLVTGGISLGSKLLLAISRDTYPEGIEWKIMIVITGVLLWWIASRKVEVIQVAQKDNF